MSDPTLTRETGKMTLSKRIPARTETITALWCWKDFTTMSPRFRRIREEFRNQMTSCYWCGAEFEDGEMMALAHFEGKGNKTLCQKCASALMEGAEDEPK